MQSSSALVAANVNARLRMWIGAVLLALGLLGHLVSAQAIGGYYIAYRDHIAGFVLLTVIATLVIGLLGRRFWRGRHDITFLAIGASQAILGFMVWLGRFNVH